MKRIFFISLFLLAPILSFSDYLPEDFKKDNYNRLEVYRFKKGDLVLNIRAKTLLHNGKTAMYSLKNLFDDNKKTVWARRRVNKDLPMMIEFTSSKPFFIKKIIFKNGCQNSQYYFKKNHRIKDFMIEWQYFCPSIPDISRGTLKDAMISQSFEYKKLRPLQGFSIYINSIYHGDKFEDICLSDLYIELSDKPTFNVSISWDKLFKIINKNKKIISKKSFCWDFKQYNKNSNYEYVYALAAYAYMGNPEAKKLLKYFKPESAFLQGIVSNWLKCMAQMKK